MIFLPAPKSKSVTHRAFLLGAFSEVPCCVRGPLLSADTRATLSVLRGLGAKIEEKANGDVCFQPFTPHAPKTPLYCGNSGTTLRLMAGQVARLGEECVLTGDASLSGRPNGPLLQALRQLGVQVTAQDDLAPLHICGPMIPGTVSLPGGLSSQFASSLLLALAMTPGGSVVDVAAPIASRPYLDLTLSVGAAFNLPVQMTENHSGLCFVIPGGARPRKREFEVEGDWSGGAFLLVAGAILGQRVIVTGLDPESIQGDRAVLEILKGFGVEVMCTKEGVQVSKSALSTPGHVDISSIPDLFPPLCILAACTEGRTELLGSPGLRHKECDRIAAMATGLSAAGVKVDERPDGLIIDGGNPRGAQVLAMDDHRIHMAFSVLGLVSAEPINVDSSASVDVSFPGFHEVLARLS